jgi:hypothetical protein
MWLSTVKVPCMEQKNNLRCIGSIFYVSKRVINNEESYAHSSKFVG